MVFKSLKEKDINTDIIYMGYKLRRVCKNEDIQKALEIHKKEIENKRLWIESHKALDKVHKKIFIDMLKDIGDNVDIIFGDF